MRADDRVLLLDVPSDAELAAIARILSQGVVVALGDAYNVDRARATFADFDNVMLIDRDLAPIPWRDDYFTLVIVPRHMQAEAAAARGELSRVIVENARIVGIDDVV